MRQYLEFIADQRLVMLGMQKAYGAKNPFSFMDLQDVQELANFFERRVSAYQIAVAGDVSFNEAFRFLSGCGNYCLGALGKIWIVYFLLPREPYSLIWRVLSSEMLIHCPVSFVRRSFVTSQSYSVLAFSKTMPSPPTDCISAFVALRHFPLVESFAPALQI